MEDRIERQLKKGALELIVLRLLAERPGYGYELLTELARRSGGARSTPFSTGWRTTGC